LAYIIPDTNIILDHPLFIYQYPNSTIVVHISLLEELDDFKNSDNLFHRKNSRLFSRLIDEATDKDNMIDKKKNIKLKIDTDKKVLMELDQTNDYRIISSAIRHSFNYETIFLSNDTNARIVAKQLQGQNLQVSDYRTSKSDHISYQKHEVYLDNFDKLFEEKELFYQLDTNRNNSHVVVISNQNPSRTTLCSYDMINSKLRVLDDHKRKGIYEIKPQNSEQVFLLNDLLNENIELNIVVSSRAGTGKTLLSLASALHLVKLGVYSKLVIIRPLVAVGGRDLGYLPGSKEEKLREWFSAIEDNLEILFAGNIGKYEEMVSQGTIELETLTYTRGRSISRSIILVDDSQNFDRHDIKTLITRAGKGSKIILTGDISQIDNRKLNKTTSGLTYIAEKSISYPNSSLNYLTTKAIRSNLSDWASGNL